MSEVVEDIAEHRKQIERIEEMLTPKKLTPKNITTPTTPLTSPAHQPPAASVIDQYDFTTDNEDDSITDMSMQCSSPLSSKVGSQRWWLCQADSKSHHTCV